MQARFERYFTALLLIIAVILLIIAFLPVFGILIIIAGISVVAAFLVELWQRMTGKHDL